MSKCSKCGQQTPQIVLDALGREVTVHSLILWLKPLNTIDRAGIRIRLTEPFAFMPIVERPCAIDADLLTMKYHIACDHTCIDGQVGERNPAIYVLANDRGEL